MNDSIILLSDIHGSFQTAHYVAKQAPNSIVVQIGDFGIGFGDDPAVGTLPSNLRFFQGNHDDHSQCGKYSQYLGRFGTISHPVERIMFIAGAETPQFDLDRRTPGKDWWADERLSDEEFDAALKFATEFQPTIVLSHDGPNSVVQEMFAGQLIRGDGYGYDSSPTRHALERILQVTSPRLWYFGHWHKYQVLERGDTTFTCLAALQAKKIL